MCGIWLGWRIDDIPFLFHARSLWASAVIVFLVNLMYTVQTNSINRLSHITPVHFPVFPTTTNSSLFSPSFNVPSLTGISKYLHSPANVPLLYNAGSPGVFAGTSPPSETPLS